MPFKVIFVRRSNREISDFRFVSHRIFTIVFLCSVVSCVNGKTGFLGICRQRRWMVRKVENARRQIQRKENGKIKDYVLKNVAKARERGFAVCLAAAVAATWADEKIISYYFLSFILCFARILFCFLFFVRFGILFTKRLAILMSMVTSS